MTAITVEYDIWPFLKPDLPTLGNQNYWLLGGMIFGWLLPSIWLVKIWANRALRYCVISFIGMQFLQMVTEFLVVRFFFISMVIPTGIVYTTYRLIQLCHLQRLLNKTMLTNSSAKLMGLGMVMLNIMFWSIVWFKLTFIFLPKIIAQIC